MLLPETLFIQSDDMDIFATGRQGLFCPVWTSGLGRDQGGRRLDPGGGRLHKQPRHMKMPRWTGMALPADTRLPRPARSQPEVV